MSIFVYVNYSESDNEY